MRKILLVILFMLCAPFAWATTYYLSFSTGSNSNNGTSKSTPWKTHPYMQNTAGCSNSPPTYSHSAGDQFIFLGGDTWPNPCWYLGPPVGDGGASGNPDYYGTDHTWFNAGVCGAAFCKPKADLQNMNFTGWAIFCPACGPGGVSHFVFDDWEIVNAFWDSAAGTNFRDIIALGNNVCDVTASNIYMHHWTHGTLASGTADILSFMRSPQSPDSTTCGNKMIDNRVDNSDGACDSGQIGNSYDIHGNEFICTPNVVVGTNFLFHDNIVNQHNANSYDDGTVPGCIGCIHENGYEAWLDMGGTEWVYNNSFLFTSPHGITTFLDPAFNANGNAATTVYFFNNLIYNSPNSPPIYIDTNCGSGVTCSQTNMSVFIWNNTMDATSNGSYGIRLVNRGYGENVGTCSIFNNHVISSQGLITTDPGITCTTFPQTTNLIQTAAVATAAGYTPANGYRPTLGSSPTVGVGTNLTSNCSGVLIALCSDANGVWNATGTGYGTGINNARPASGSWDAGAYSFGGSGPPGPPPVTLLSKSLPTGTVGAPYSFTLQATGGTPPYTWTGSGFPTGLSLAASGVLSGTPQVAGQFSLAITATDSTSMLRRVVARLRGHPLKLAASGTLPLIINPATPPPTSTKFALGDTGKVITGGSRLNVRSAPSPTASVVTTLANGTTFTITGGPGSGGGVLYWQITQGWVADAYVRQ